MQQVQEATEDATNACYTIRAIWCDLPPTQGGSWNGFARCVSCASTVHDALARFVFVLFGFFYRATRPIRSNGVAACAAPSFPAAALHTRTLATRSPDTGLGETLKTVETS